MKNKNKVAHCDKCSYKTTEGLAITGCAYCGCHDKSTKPIENKFRIKLWKIIIDYITIPQDGVIVLDRRLVDQIYKLTENRIEEIISKYKGCMPCSGCDICAELKKTRERL